MKKIIAAIAAFAFGISAFAGGDIAPIEEQTVVTESELSGFYAGAGYSYVDNDLGIAGVNLTEHQNGLTILGGYNINEYVAVEGRYTFADSTDFANIIDVDGDLWGIYVKPQYNISNDIKVYALLGYGDVKSIDNGDGFQYGLGLAYGITKNVEIFGDWIRAYDDDLFSNDDAVANGTIDVFTIGANYKF